MKKIFLLAIILGFFAIQSCTTNDGIPGRDGKNGQDGSISEVFELKNINFKIDDKGNFFIKELLNPNIFSSDIILIYRLVDVVNPNTPIWQPIPRTIFFKGTSKELDYDFEFTKSSFTIYAGGNFPLTTEPAFLSNQTFRIVIVPGAFSSKSSVSRTLSYEESIAKYKIDDSKIKILN